MDKQLCKSEDEYGRLMKILNFRLDYKFKKIGLLGAVLTLAFLIGYKFFGSDLLIMKDLLRTLILLFMLIASLSRDSFEDEFNRHIRLQSYMLAFVCATIYCISLPLISVVMDVLITKISGDGSVNFHDVSAFEVMFILMGFQLLFFKTLKRFGRA